jgi:hypothetical protein
MQVKLVPRESIGGEALYVQDPLDAENNVGSSCFAFHHVQQVFRDALARLEASLGGPAAAAEAQPEASLGRPVAAAEAPPDLDLLGRLLDTRAVH